MEAIGDYLMHYICDPVVNDRELVQMSQGDSLQDHKKKFAACISEINGIFHGYGVFDCSLTGNGMIASYSKGWFTVRGQSDKCSVTIHDSYHGITYVYSADKKWNGNTTIPEIAIVQTFVKGETDHVIKTSVREFRNPQNYFLVKYFIDYFSKN